MKVSFITTIYNEEKTILRFLTSLNKQTKNPDEIIIVDGGSTDGTEKIIEKFKFRISKNKVTFITKKGNRSVGRNEAIKRASGEIIVCSDAGNELHKDWINNITKPFAKNKTDVVAGYYDSKPKNIFQKCLVPFAFVMPDKVNPETFLPATRSIAFKKSIWKKAGMFDEKFSHNEDYVFAHALKAINAKIVFARDAIVTWFPRNTYKEAFVMFYRFALGDAEAGIMRPNVLLLFARYFIGLYWVFLCLLYKSISGIYLLILVLCIYIIWSIKKNYKYVQDIRAFIILPRLQFTADFAVMTGTLYGIFKKVKTFNSYKYITNNKLVLLIISLYAFILFATMQWGIPNSTHPFPYHMDEWHQLHAVGTTFKNGTPNIEGSANGTMLHFIYTGFYLIPFTVLQYIDPFSLQIDNAIMREKIFEVLRLQTIIFGVLSLLIFYMLSKKLKLPATLAVFLFAVTPVWLILSGYFKYDIALICFTIISLLFFIRYRDDPSVKNLLLSSVPVGLAIAVKVSAVPLVIMYVISYLLFTKKLKADLKYFTLGLIVIGVTVLLFGLPDTLFGKGNILYYLYDNILQTPAVSTGFILNAPPLLYIFIKQVPIIFGYGLYVATIVSLLYFMYRFIFYGIKKFKTEVFIIIGFILFLLSILPLQIYAGGNRSLILLPFMVLICSFAIKDLIKTKFKLIVIIVVILLGLIQTYQGYSWMQTKIMTDPQLASSQWIEQHIKKGELIGIENIPIYQHLPNIIEKEFYYHENNPQINNNFKYQIVSAETKKLPSIVIVTNAEVERMLLKDSPKNKLVNRLVKDNYKNVKSFQPDLKYYYTFGNNVDFYIANIVPMPLSISIYEKAR